MDSLRRDEYAIDALELKALSVPSALLFLLGVECDAALCIATAGTKRKVSVQFPLLGEQARKLLELCGARLNLTCTHSAASSILEGVGTLPVLRYVDFLPGQLHMDEVLASLGIAKPRTQPSIVSGSTNTFTAAFIDYAPYANDDLFADLSNGQGFCMTLERGVSLATHSHLVAIRFKSGKGNSSDNIRQFQRYCGWNTFDLRFDDEGPKCATGVVVMPSVQDAMDLFEKYEDEDSDDDDADALRFSIRPVAPLVAVPFVEDAQLRKFRLSHWSYVLDFWGTFPKTRRCVMVSNLYEKATLPEVIKLFEGLSIVDSALVEDASPFRRRRAFVTFSDDATCREALGMDGKNTHGKALRIQAAPPFVDASRRGALVRSRSPSPSPLITPAMKSGRSPSPIPDLALPAAVSPAQKFSSSELPPARPLSAAKGKTPKVSPAMPPSQVTAQAKSATSPAPTKPVESPSPSVPPATATTDDDAPKKTPGMNAAAKEFVPKFAMSPLVGSSSPPPYVPSGSLPPPYIPQSPLPPPAYSPPPPYIPTPQSTPSQPAAVSLAPPAYSLPPPYHPGQRSPQTTAAPPNYAPPAEALKKD
jgi:hypothetical protein